MDDRELLRIERKVDEVLVLLRGGPSTPQRGLIVRVDRLEQTEKRRAFWITTALSAWIVTITAAVAAKLGLN